ncbi:OLC1v1009001C1 [Oldenlandia corymbosa var. corymbosa]|uniref:RNA helicase n=1 Tax=Oldenlandia corymbosa var. corymbosa TaxID=529605 RepID=A0AAV1DMU7_OLDCO|nr:OLC1v1009001C1 [Oldenlandia corymbosa var. corymbosa]
MDDAKSKIRKDDSEMESLKRSHRDRDREDRKRDKEKNGERTKDRDRDRDRDRDHRRSSSDKKDRKDKDRDRERERSIDDKYRDREKSIDDKYRGREKSVDEKYRDRDKERHKDKHKEKDREKERTSTRDAEKARDKGREREDREVHMEKDEKERERGKDKEMDREKDRERDREREKEKEREREERERDRERERRERDRGRERERREREREREREKEKERVREREKRREADRDPSSDDSDVKDRDRKRRRRDDSHKDRDREQSSKSHKHKDNGEDSSPQKRSNEDFVEKKEENREEELAEEQRKLDEEMEKRRRRVQEWQELRRKKEESERESLGVAANAEEPQSGKTWTLEGESDDEEARSDGKEDTDMDVDEGGKLINSDRDDMAIDSENGHVAGAENEAAGATADEEIDPLDAFMNSMVLPEVERLHSEPPPPEDFSKNLNEKSNRRNGEHPKKGVRKSMGRIIAGEDSDSDYEDYEKEEDPLEDEDDAEFFKRVKKTKAEKLAVVDHSKIEYPPFRKNFYIEVKEISKMTSEEVAAYRKELELKIHGKDVPKPVRTWHQMGLSTKILETIRKLDFEKPMPIQAQALPVIMSGRDCIGIAKTGSGKTLAFVLPMLRHIKDQPPLMPGDGPIGLIMAPTRELVQQIHSDVKRFSKILGLSCVPVYGGSGVAQQISELKRGAEIVVCTPGRMIDILCTSAGKITNLRRVTYLVMDEADRMFDMGFEPQITKIVQNTRPDRQTVLFSATFPRQVEILARKVLNKPVEIQVGGRSVVNKDIEQLVEVRPESDRFLRLLELLGKWYEKGKILIFVHSQEKCDALFRDLLKHGYPCLSLHGAKDQTDRESTIADFKSNVCNLLIATSVAARGLDVKELELVINYDVPNHYEDYVHRVGRTGRAGRKGCAITFISEDDARYAPDLVKALELSQQVVPSDLKALADGFMAKVNQGLEQAHGTGYGGSGFKFNEEEDEVRKAAKKAQAKEYGFEEDKSDSDDEEGVRKAGGSDLPQLVPNGALPGILNLPAATTVLTNGGITIGPSEASARALAAAMNLKHNLAKLQADAIPEHYEAELEINDFPQNARWKVTHKETLGPISEWTGAAITTRGQFFPPGKIPGPGDRKLFLFIEGPNEQSVKRAKAELKRVLEDITNQASALPGAAQPGRYSVV